MASNEIYRISAFPRLSRPKMKSIEISTQGSLRTGKGVYNPWGITLDLAYLHVMHLEQS